MPQKYEPGSFEARWRERWEADRLYESAPRDDWSKELATCLPEYYRWNQWFFIQLFKQGLAYRRMAPVNWCPTDQVVLAREQVVNGRCWRCDTLVIQRDLEQWFFKITAYADELLADLDTIEWPERVKAMQRN